MTDWMFETLLWTAVLIAFVLLVRRPVSRTFGPQIAYALWALPALRLILPPIELPAWMRIAEPEAPLEAAAGSEKPIHTVMDELPAARFENAVVAHPAAPEVTSPLTPASHFDFGSFDFGMLVEAGVAVWLLGAATFLALRFSAYFRLRDELLEEGREVGRSGAIRLIETPGTKAPLAFGVIDKVVALPEGFLAHPDRQSRDLALAHELAHHKGGDLLANILVQPLFAIHWWNPLGRYGWLALRRDQEAACDARVMACAEREDREVYANLIVSFAAGPNVAPNYALAAPMACPVLGEKSIVHRLRSLNMDNKTTKRRLAGKALVGAAVVALPMTASISYAASELPQAPDVAVNPQAVPVALAAPQASAAPSAPEAPEAPLVEEEQIIVIDPDGEVSGVDSASENVFVWQSEDGDEERRLVFRKGSGNARFLENSDFPTGKRMSKEDMERLKEDMERLIEKSENARVILRNRSNILRNRSNSTHFFDRSELDAEGRLSEEQIEKILSEVRESLEEANKTLEELPEIIEKAQADAEVMRLESRRTFRVERGCDGDGSEIVTESEGADGFQILRICQKGVMKQALEGLREARRSIKKSDELSGQARRNALREMDRAISRLERDAR